jgi:hypothetical protein
VAKGVLLHGQMNTSVSRRRRCPAFLSVGAASGEGEAGP